MESGITFKSLIHLELIFVSDVRVGVQFHFFTCCPPVFPTAFTKEAILSPFCVLGSIISIS